jgi:heptosyltransferase-2
LSMNLGKESPSSELAKQTNFAVRVPNWLGDSVLALPAVRTLAECSRRGRLVVLASTSSAEVFSRVPGTLVFGIKSPGTNLVGWIRAIYDGSMILRRFAPVMVFSMTKSFTSAATCFLGRVPRRIGFSNGAWRLLYTDRVPLGGPRREHLTETYCRVVESMGLKVQSKIPVLDPTAEDLEAGEGLIAGHGLKRRGFLCLFPGARYGPAKRWEISRFALLGDRVVGKFGLDVVILGGKEDRTECEAVAAGMKAGVLNLCGDLGFSALVGLLSLSGGVVANDSGGMHLAAALGVPVVGLFFSTRPDWTRPLAPRSTVLSSSMACSPCFKRDCRKGNICTTSIAVDDVMASLEPLIGEGD